MSEILAVRGLFSGSPLGMRRMSVDHMVRINPPHTPFKEHFTVMFESRVFSVLVVLAETPQPSVVPHAPPPSLPDWPPPQQPRPGAVAAGPGPVPAGPRSAGRL